MTRDEIRRSIWLGLSVVLALCTIVGGILARGLKFAVVIVAVGLLVTACALLYYLALRRRRPYLGPAAFAYPKPEPSQGPAAASEAPAELARAALVLLGIEKTATGLWGRSYVYRQDKPNLAGGSLGGTPSVLEAMHSIAGEGSRTVIEWTRHPLTQTLDNLVDDDGKYVRGETETSVGTQMDFEPSRHAAGGVLMGLWICPGRPDPKTLKTIGTLCAIEPVSYSWDNALIARALLQASQTRGIPTELRRSARRTCEYLVDAVIKSARDAPRASRTWADKHGLTLDVTNFWATVWVVLPFLRPLCLDRRRQAALEEVIKLALHAHAAAAGSAGSLLPSSVETDGTGRGETVFGSAMAVAAWRTLELYGATREQEGRVAVGESTLAVERFLRDPVGLLELPSLRPGGERRAVEGYFAWAGVLMALASIGVRLSDEDVDRARRLSTALLALEEPANDAQANRIVEMVKGAGLVKSETALAITRSFQRVMALAARHGSASDS